MELSVFGNVKMGSMFKSRLTNNATSYDWVDVIKRRRYKKEIFKYLYSNYVAAN